MNISNLSVYPTIFNTVQKRVFENNSGNNPASITFLRMILILFAVIALILLLYWLERNPSELNTSSDNSAGIYSSFNFFL